MPVISGASDLPIPRQAVLGPVPGAEIPSARITKGDTARVEAAEKGDSSGGTLDSSRSFAATVTVADRLGAIDPGTGTSPLFDRQALEPDSFERELRFLDRLAELRTADLFGDPAATSEVTVIDTGTTNQDNDRQPGRFDKFA